MIKSVGIPPCRPLLNPPPVCSVPACGLSLSTSRPRGIKGPTTPKPAASRTTPKYMRDFEDGKMDEEETDPITVSRLKRRIPSSQPYRRYASLAPRGTFTYDFVSRKHRAGRLLL